jgi:hypothetical protein
MTPEIPRRVPYPANPARFRWVYLDSQQASLWIEASQGEDDLRIEPDHPAPIYVEFPGAYIDGDSARQLAHWLTEMADTTDLWTAR